MRIIYIAFFLIILTNILPNSYASPLEEFVMPTDQELQKKLTKEQYNVTQKMGTEPAFKNSYWNHKKHGIYVDIISGEALFSSIDKYKSGTGWPSFTRPLEPKNIVQRTDWKLFYPRQELRSQHANSHLGHVFKDGPQPTGLRYCVNSAALRFIPVEKMTQSDYGKYLKPFQSQKLHN